MRKLRRIRAEKGLTMDALEERTGVSKRTISEIERGMRSPQTLTLAKLANALDVDLDDLLEEEVPKAIAPPKEEMDLGRPGRRGFDAKTVDEMVRGMEHLPWKEQRVVLLLQFLYRLQLQFADDAEILAELQRLNQLLESRVGG